MGQQGSQTSDVSWRAVLFDLDGTLADTIHLILESYRHTMQAHLGRVPPDSRWLETIGRPLRDSLRLFAGSPEEVLEMTETYVAFQRAHHDDLVDHYPGVPEVLERLAAEGVPMAVVTSKRRRMALRTLARCGIGDFFQGLVCADDVERGKPDPEPVRLALTELGLTAGQDIIFVGDSIFDLQAGRKAGVATAAALWGPIERNVLAKETPDLWLEHPRDLFRMGRFGP